MSGSQPEDRGSSPRGGNSESLAICRKALPFHRPLRKRALNRQNRPGLKEAPMVQNRPSPKGPPSALPRPSLISSTILRSYRKDDAEEASRRPFHSR